MSVLFTLLKCTAFKHINYLLYNNVIILGIRLNIRPLKPAGYHHNGCRIYLHFLKCAAFKNINYLLSINLIISNIKYL